MKKTRRKRWRRQQGARRRSRIARSKARDLGTTWLVYALHCYANGVHMMDDENREDWEDWEGLTGPDTEFYEPGHPDLFDDPDLDDLDLFNDIDFDDDEE